MCVSRSTAAHLYVLYCTILSLCVLFYYNALNICGPESHIPFHVLNAYRGFLTLRRVSPFVAKIYVRNTNLVSGRKKTRMQQKHKVLGQFLRAFIDLFCSAGLGRNFVRKAWKVGTNEQRSLMGRATKEQGRSPAGSNTETSVSHRTKRTQTFGGHMVFEISSQFQTIWWIELTLLLNSLAACEQRP